MAQLSVTGAAAKLPIDPDERPAIWNSGPDALFLSRTQAGASAAKGFPVAPDTGYEWPTDANGDIWAKSAGTSDVRIMNVG